MAWRGHCQGLGWAAGQAQQSVVKGVQIWGQKMNYGLDLGLASGVRADSDGFSCQHNSGSSLNFRLEHEVVYVISFWDVVRGGLNSWEITLIWL